MTSTTPQSRPIDAPPNYPFPKDEKGHMPWSRVLEQLVPSRNYWLATVRPDGRPHVAPLWGIWLDNILYFEGSPTTRWARNLAGNSAASVNLESGNDVVIIEGIAESFVLDAELRSRLIAAWAEKYGQYGPGPETEDLFRLRPRVIRAWSLPMENGARWIFSDS